MPARCQICESASLAIVDDVSKLPRVTSDSQPFRPGAMVGVCRSCGTVQSVPTESWKAEIAEIYANYQIYRQSSGVEQGVVDGGGEFKRRSAALVDRIKQSGQFSSSGRLLDIGCGNGAMLRSFSEQLPGWELHGLELDDKYRSQVEAIPGAKLFVGDLSQLDGTYDLITMLHALEHFIKPQEILGEIAKKLSPSGLLFIEVPNFAANPFDLVVADHSCHFTLESLAYLLRQAGYEVVAKSDTWVAKELSFLARYRGGAPAASAGSGVDAARMFDYTMQCVRWLEEASRIAVTQRRSPKLAVFGTSLAATWLFAELDGKVDQFVDEDATRIGTYFDKPVVHPNDIQGETDVFLPFPYPIAVRIAERMKDRPFHVILPPSFPVR